MMKLIKKKEIFGSHCSQMINEKPNSFEKKNEKPSGQSFYDK